MNFYDEHWLAALNIARSLSPEHIHILVPDEFVNDRDVFYPAKQASQLLCRDITAFVIPKDYVEYLPIRLIQDDQFKQFCCIWADEVFVAFSSLAESLECSEAEVQRHIPAFLKRKEQILYNDKREDVLCEKLPYLLDTQENRLLKQMFPHKCYCMEQFKGLSLFPTVIKREVVKYCVKEVRIELSSYCNRSCAYCPVSILDRKNMEKKISKAIFEKCVAELQEIDFAGQLWFCMFNEPLYDQDLLMYALQYVNQHLPQCCVKIVTNGDYLTTDYLEKLVGNYLDELTVSVHYDGKWNRDTQLAQMEEILKRLELCGKGIIKESEGRLVCTVDPVSYNSTRLRSFSLRSEDFSMHGLDRAGTIPQGVLRKENLDPCPRLVFEHLNVAYDGNIVPCCNMCSDVPGMEKWFYGNVMDRGGIFSAYTSPVAAEFRRNLFAPREQDQYTPEPCTTCAEGIYDFNENLVRSDCELRREMRPLIMQAWHSHL